MKKDLFVLVVILILFSCGETGEQEDAKHVNINNVSIAYNECGKGDTTLLFVHGWCINKEYWSDQVNHFCDNYKIITLDLPGFGQSGKNRTEWTFEKYAEDVNEFIRIKELKNVILIGHSMSGDILLLMDTKYPGSVIGIVGIDNLQEPGIKNTEQQTKEIESLFAMMESNFSATVEGYTKNSLFPPSADSTIVNRVVNDFKMNDSVIAVKVFRSMVDIYQKERDLMQQLTHTLFLVNTDMNPTKIDSLKKYCKASTAVVYVNGTGHYPMVEKPAEFNAALEKVIRMIGEN